MITVVLAKDYKKAALGEDFLWCYIGKDIRRREKVSSAFGPGRRFFLGDRLRDITEELRKPFLDFISGMGRRQRDRINWWASTFASKSPYHTDFFLLLCYFRLVERLLAEFTKNDGNICIVVEDPWLFRMLSDRISATGLEFVDSQATARKKFLLALRGLTYRTLLFFFLLTQKSLMRVNFLLRSRGHVRNGKKTIAIMSFIEPRAFAGGGFRDPYMVGLSDFLRSKGFNIVRPTYIAFPFFLSLKASGCDPLWPLLFDIGAADMLRALSLRWRPELPGDFPLKIDGIDVGGLIEREIWTEFSRTSFNTNVMYRHAARNFFRRQWCNSFVYHYENLPFEKMICLAAEEFPGLRLVGYRDTPTPWFYLSTFFGEGEKEILPLPHRVLTIGNYTLRMFKERGNYPPLLLAVGGALRYRYLHGSLGGEEGGGNTVLIATPIDPYISRLMLSDVNRSFSGADSGLRFLVKCHPATPFHSLGINLDGEHFEVVDEPVEILLKRADTVVYAASAVGLEFLVRGKSVVRYVLENMINMDSLEGIDESLYMTCYEGNCRDIILRAVNRGVDGERLKRAETLRADYFGEVQYDVWLGETGG